MPVPDQIRSVELPRTLLRGYSRSAVQQLLDEIADAYADALRERDELAAQVEALKADVDRHDELESLLRSTLVLAERASWDAKEQARREADLIVQEAHAESRRLTRKTTAQLQHAEVELQAIKARLRAAVESLAANRELGDEPPSPDRPAETRPEQDDTEPSSVPEALDSAVRKLVG